MCAAAWSASPCLEMALQTGDQHVILGGTTRAERVLMRRQGQVAHARQHAEWRVRPGAPVAGLEGVEKVSQLLNSMDVLCRVMVDGCVRLILDIRSPAMGLNASWEL